MSHNSQFLIFNWPVLIWMCPASIYSCALCPVCSESTNHVHLCQDTDPVLWTDVYVFLCSESWPSALTDQNVFVRSFCLVSSDAEERSRDKQHASSPYGLSSPVHCPVCRESTNHVHLCQDTRTQPSAQICMLFVSWVTTVSFNWPLLTWMCPGLT